MVVSALWFQLDTVCIQVIHTLYPIRIHSRVTRVKSLSEPRPLKKRNYQFLYLFLFWDYCIQLGYRLGDGYIKAIHFPKARITSSGVVSSLRAIERGSELERSLICIFDGRWNKTDGKAGLWPTSCGRVNNKGKGLRAGADASSHMRRGQARPKEDGR
jgi:hypothetical protein